MRRYRSAVGTIAAPRPLAAVKLLVGLSIFSALVLCAAGWLATTATAQKSGGAAQTEKPSEAVLPGAVEPAGQRPSEAVLPGQQKRDDDDLPGEDQLAGDQGAGDQGAGDQGAGDQGAGDQDEGGAQDDTDASAPIAGRAPILRLALDGHTGLVRTLDISDGGRTLVSAGEDKEVHVWRRTDIGNTGWLHRRTIRWPVSRGPRGVIYNAKLKGDLVAFAGYGAFGSNGEIRIVDVASGQLLRTLVDTQNGHLANILSLCWSPADKPRLASIDMEGRLMEWQADPTTGIWEGKTWVDVDRVTYGEEVAAELTTLDRRAYAGVSFVGEHYLVAPRLVVDAKRDDGVKVWHLERFDLRTGQSELFSNMDHLRCVRAISATNDGRVMASTDFGGSIGLWTFGEDGSVAGFQQFQPGSPPMVIDLDGEGKRMLVGTEKFGESQQAKLQHWDVQATPPKLLSERNMGDHVYSVALDDANDDAIATQGIHLEIHSLDPQGQFQEQPPKMLRAPAKPILKVAFEKADGYQIAFGWNRDDAGAKQLEGVFDLADSKLLGAAPINPDDFASPQRMATRWAPYGPLADYRFQLYEGDQPRGMLPLLVNRHGVPTAVCTLPAPETDGQQPDEEPATGAVFVGTRGQNGIYAYKTNASDPPELLRQFRGHSGLIHSLSTSSDSKYLVSGAGDSTISIWNLQDIFRASKMVNRWGVDFEIEADRLLASDVREDGPLYFRGVRGGDHLALIEWVDDNARYFAESDAAKMRQRLLDLPFDIQVRFKFRRLDRPGPDFQSFPAWRPLATLFVDQTREWAYWTPAGYYDASFNGHQQFGWQLNNLNVDRPVEYFRAAQFRKMLERPDIMRRLLEAGSLPGAVRQTLTQIGPPPAEGAIVNQIQSKPRIRLLSPDPSQTVRGDRLSVRAAIEVPTGATLVPPKAFVSGVPAIDRQVVANGDDATAGTTTYQWQFRLPSDRELQLEILAATEAESIERVLVDLDHQLGDAPRPKPRLHVLAIGASQYRDPQIQSLDFAAKAAGDISELFRSKSAQIYRTSTDRLVDGDATRSLWRVFAQSAAEQLSATVSPDDLVIMYLCGHGLRDRRTDQWYFVTADARYSDLMNDQYDDCIAFSDLAALSKLPCRKLAILDSCHSGAVQPLMRRDDLKSALRFLQDDVVLTLTASEGDQEAAEQRETRLGRFTAALVDALNGQARDLDGDQTVSLGEVIDYVSRRVTEESEQEGLPQHPTASPNYLLRTLQLPLTAR